MSFNQIVNRTSFFEIDKLTNGDPPVEDSEDEDETEGKTKPSMSSIGELFYNHTT